MESRPTAMLLALVSVEILLVLCAWVWTIWDLTFEWTCVGFAVGAVMQKFGSVMNGSNRLSLPSGRKR